MAARGALLIVAWLAGIASADPAPKPVDIKPFRDKLIVLKDADGGIYAVMNEKGETPRVFYGTTKVLYQVILEGARGRDGDGWHIALLAPRTEYPFMATLERSKAGEYRCHCGNQGPTYELAQLGADKAKEILDKAKFMTTQLVRRPHMLARDDRGVYYYVDVLRDQYGGNGHRVFVGKKGALKQMPMNDIAIDTAGEVYSTKSGDLRLVKKTSIEDNIAKTVNAAQWIRGERKNDLSYLDVYMNQPLIYRELGVYKVTGTLCGTL